MPTSAASRGAAVVCSALALAVGLAGCASAPGFTTPIRWSEGTQLVYGDAEPQLPEPVAAVGELSIELGDGGRGAVRGIPRGTLSERPDGAICVDAIGEPYSGEVRWRATSEWGVELAYDGGALLIQSAPGKLAEDWSELRIFPCGVERAYWRVGISCGSLGADRDAQLGLRRCEAS